jgi:hypothetical protein
MENHTKHATSGSYQALGIEMAIDFVIMYLVMYTMIATLDHFHVNLNTAYMTLMMVAPMTRAMIPHHSGAILMCKEASLHDRELVALCEQIVKSQQAEIAQMEEILARR